MKYKFNEKGADRKSRKMSRKGNFEHNKGLHSSGARTERRAARKAAAAAALAAAAPAPVAA